MKNPENYEREEFEEYTNNDLKLSMGCHWCKKIAVFNIKEGLDRFLDYDVRV